MEHKLEASQTCANVIFSFDFEIGWGDITNPLWRMRERNGVYDRLRHVLPEILACTDEYAFPITWATVGAMFDEPSNRDFGHLPTQAQALIHQVLAEAKASSFDGRDLFEMVLNSKSGHRIASHSYSHVPFTYEEMDCETVAKDLNHFGRVLSDFGLKTDYLVFPENRESCYDALVRSGIKTARVAADNSIKNRHLYRLTAPFLAPPLGRDELHASGVTRQYGSMLFNTAGKSWRLPLIKRRFALGLQKAIHEGGTLHVWGHPFNYAASEPLKDALIETIAQLARLRDQGKVKISVM